MKRRAWTDIEEQYLRDNYEFGDLDHIASKLGRTKIAIRVRSAKLGLKRDAETSRNLFKKYDVNESFFSAWSNEMSYVLGFICADGNLSKLSNNINITLCENDSYLLKYILECMHSTHKIIDKKNKGFNYKILSITNKLLYQDLLRLGLTPCKSRTLVCPNVPKKFMPHFVRGVMDGDGAVITKRKVMKIVSASESFVIGLSNIYNSMGINHKLYNEPYISHGIKTDFYSIRVMRLKDMQKLYKLIYNEAGKLYLTRKMKNFIDMGIKDKNFTNRHRNRLRPVFGVNLETGERIEFDSMEDTKHSGFNPSCVHKVASGERKYHKNYVWKFSQRSK